MKLYTLAYLRRGGPWGGGPGGGGVFACGISSQSFVCDVFIVSDLKSTTTCSHRDVEV